MKTKICNKCHQEKSLYHFGKNKSIKNGLQYECKKCRRKSAKTRYCNNKEYSKKYQQKYCKINIDSWRSYFPIETKCQICNKVIYFSGNSKSHSIHFDHCNNGKEIIKNQPSNWLMRHPRNPKNEKIFESCNFGMLCGICNQSLPTKNREEWLSNAIKYHYKGLKKNERQKRVANLTQAEIGA